MVEASEQEMRMVRVLTVVAMLLGMTSLGGCVVAPRGGYYARPAVGGYYAAPRPYYGRPYRPYRRW